MHARVSTCVCTCMSVYACVCAYIPVSLCVHAHTQLGARVSGKTVAFVLVGQGLDWTLSSYKLYSQKSLASRSPLLTHPSHWKSSISNSCRHLPLDLPVQSPPMSWTPLCLADAELCSCSAVSTTLPSCCPHVQSTSITPSRGTSCSHAPSLSLDTHTLSLINLYHFLLNKTLFNE